MEEVIKDSVGQEIKIGDKIAVKDSTYADMTIYKILHFTKNGRPIVSSGWCRSTYIKIFDQDEKSIQDK